MNSPTTPDGSKPLPFTHDIISHIESGLEPGDIKLYVGGSEAARDIALLREHKIEVVINCAVNLDINYVIDPNEPVDGEKCAHGTGPVRVYKLGLVDGAGNAERMMLAGYYLLDGAIRQVIPDKKTYPRSEVGNVLVHCRGGRSRSTALVSLYLHINMPQKYPTLDSAVQHVREKRGLHPDEWYSAPKPVLLASAQSAATIIQQLR